MSLAGMGHFTLTAAAAPLDDKKAEPAVDIRFRPDPKAPIDPALVAYISSATGKMKPLAQSDLESFLEIGQQLLNISKPFVITGIGSLVKGSDRQLSFVQGDGGSVEEKLSHRKLGQEETDLNYEDKLYGGRTTPSAPAGRRLAVAALVGVGILTIGLVAWYFYQQSQQGNGETLVLQADKASEVLTQPETSPTASIQVVPATDSLQLTSKDSSSTTEKPLVATPQLAAPSSFEVVLEVARRNRALKRYADLQEWGHKVRMRTEDSVTFKLSIPIDAPLSDSTRHRDSLSRFFGRKVWIETH